MDDAKECGKKGPKIWTSARGLRASRGLERAKSCALQMRSKAQSQKSRKECASKFAQQLGCERASLRLGERHSRGLKALRLCLSEGLQDVLRYAPSLWKPVAWVAEFPTERPLPHSRISSCGALEYSPHYLISWRRLDIATRGAFLRA